MTRTKKRAYSKYLRKFGGNCQTNRCILEDFLKLFFSNNELSSLNYFDHFLSSFEVLDPLCECGSLLSPINPLVTSSPWVTTPEGKNGLKITTPFLLVRFKSRLWWTRPWIKVRVRRNVNRSADNLIRSPNHSSHPLSLPLLRTESNKTLH